MKSTKKRIRRRGFMSWMAVMAVGMASANAQESQKSTPEPAPAPATPKTVINLWPGAAPGSEQWKQPETTLRPGAIANVTTPTLTVYLPPPSTATGTGVIIAPGGGFISLSIDSEGHDVAKWLVARGFAAFVLKYRTVQLEGQDAAQIGQSAGARFGAQLRDLALIDEDGKYGIADGIQAVKVVCARAAEWGISSDRIVFTGFSAGGMITAFAAIQPDARPNTTRLLFTAPLSQPCRRYHKDCRPSSWRWRKTTISPGVISSASTKPSRPPDTARNSTFTTPAVMAGACANKANRATTGSTSSTTGWRRKG